ncbi:MAG TPA: chromosome segregation protein, partial [Sphingomonas sp.]
EAEQAEAGVAAAGEAQRVAADRAGAATRTLAGARSAAQVARDAANAAGYRLETLKAERAALDRRLAEVGKLREALARDRARESALAEDAAAAIARLTAEEAALAIRLAEAVAARPALAARLGETETALRDAEVALAQALAADAAEQVEARIAQAAHAAARQRLDRADAEIARIARDRAALGDAAQFEAAMAQAAAGREAAAADVARLAEAIQSAETARAGAAGARDGAQAATATARAGLASLESEGKALARSLPPPGATRRALDEMRAAPGFERALAAALGDDLDAPVAAAGRMRWAGAEGAGDPVLPAGCAPLAAHVEAPAALARRLAQIGVVEADDGTIRLAAGQRLVTRDGRLRRWDGFIAEDRGAAAAEGLIRRNRLAEIEAQLVPARDAVAVAEAAMREAAAALDRAQVDGQAARGERGKAETRLRDATMAEDRARLAAERIAVRRAELDERAAIAAAERQTAFDEAERAAAAVAALPDGERSRRNLADRRAAAESARSGVAQLRADLAALDRGLAADRDRRAAAAAEAEGWRARSGDAVRRIEEMSARAEAAAEDHAVLAATPAGLDARRAAAEAGQASAAVAARDTAAAEAVGEAALREAEAALASVGEALATMREQRAAAAARHENQETRRVEMGRVSGERFQCPAPLLPEKTGFAAQDVGEVEGESRRLETLTLDRERIGPVNLVAEEELAALDAERAGQAADRDELAQAVARLRGSIGSLNREGRVRLLAAFEAVDGHFRRLFSRLFAGGEAHLALIDSDDPLEAGLEIMAQPPGKKLASLTLLSGGEQALTAVALIFALFLTNPAPICVLDEVDAPLDDANIERFCDLLDQMCRETDTRYLVVTHNAVSMARMHRLFGVTMVERGVSRLVSVDLGGAETLLAAA